MFYARVEIKKSNKNKNMYEKQKGIKFNALVINTPEIFNVLFYCSRGVIRKENYITLLSFHALKGH